MPTSIVTCPNRFSFQIHVVLLDLLACTRNKCKRHSPILPSGSGLQCLTQMLADCLCQTEKKGGLVSQLSEKIPKPASPRLAALPQQPGTRHWRINDKATIQEDQAWRSHSCCG